MNDNSNTKTVKFELLVDLGIITVPADYNHETFLANFREKHKEEFWDFDDNIIDTNFSNPSRILKACDKFHVRAFQQIQSEETTSEERMDFLATQSSILVGSQGLPLVFEQKRDQIPKGKWYLSFDEKESFWKDEDNKHCVPALAADMDGDFRLDLGYFEESWDETHILLSFTELSQN